MSSKWLSRKFLLAIIGAIYTMAATGGWDIPIEQVALVDAILAVWIVVEGIIDAIRAKK